MIVTIIMTCLAVTASTVPVTPSMALMQPTQRGDLPAQKDPLLEVTPGTQVLVQIQPNVQQPQPGPQQQGAQGGPQFLLPMQHQPWAPQGLPLYMPFQPSIQGPSPVNNQPSQQPQHQLMFPQYGYFPVFPSPQGNQLPFPPQFSPYGFPMIFQAPPQQFPANPQPAGPVAPVQQPAVPAAGPVAGPAAGPVAGPVAGPAAPEPREQPQNPHILYMFQQPMNAQLGGLSSEELEMAARMAQVGMFLPSVQANVPAEAAKPLPGNQPTGPVSLNPGLPVFFPSPGLMPTMGILQGGVPQTEGVPVPGALPDANIAPVGLETPRQDTATVPAPVTVKSNPGTVDTNTPPAFVNNQMDFFLETAPKKNIARETNKDIFP